MPQYWNRQKSYSTPRDTTLLSTVVNNVKFDCLPLCSCILGTVVNNVKLDYLPWFICSNSCTPIPLPISSTSGLRSFRITCLCVVQQPGTKLRPERYGYFMSCPIHISGWTLNGWSQMFKILRQYAMCNVCDTANRWKKQLFFNLIII